MRKQKRQNRKHKGSRSWGNILLNHCTTIGLIVFSGIIMGYVFLNQDGLPGYYQMVQDAERLKEEIQHLGETNATLRQDIHRMQHDPLKVEELARNHLGMVRQDEVVYQFVDAEPPQPDPTSIAEADR